MKTGLSALDISAWLTENSQELLGSRVDSVYSIDSILLLRLRTKNGDKTLVMKPGHYIYLTNVHEKELPGARPHTQLNQLLKGEVITSVEQLDAERILELRLGSHLEAYLELFSSGQLAIVSEGKIVYLLRSLRAKDRTLELGKSYALPPPRGLPLDRAKELEKIGGPSLPSLTHNISFPLEGIREALARANVPENQELNSDSFRSFLAEAEKLWELTKRRDKLRPVVVETEDGKSFHPFPFISEKGTQREKASFNEAIEETFSRELVQLKREEEERLEKTVKSAISTAERHKLKAQELKSKVELLSTLAPSLSVALSEISGLQKKRGWDAIVPSEIAGLHLKSKDPSSGTVTFEEAPDIPLKINKKIWDQISELHEEQEEEERKEISAMKKIEELQTSLSRKKEEDRVKDLEASMRLARKREWYERYRWFITSDNILVIAGKDADQNISIIRNLLKSGLWALHADVHGSPLAIIYQDAEEVPELSINEAAQFVAAYSKAWSDRLLSVKVSVFRSEQISLSPPSGTFLSKGSFMIYGKRRELDAELALSIGVEVGEGWFRVISGPPTAIEKRALAYVTLKPGDVKRERLVEMIRKSLAFKLKKLGSPLSSMIKDSDIDPLLPSGGGTLLPTRAAQELHQQFSLKRSLLEDLQLR
ncbi:MAG: ribosome rescue protein RqcH [Thermoprotei archaeon]